MFTEIPISVLTEPALLTIRNSLENGNRFSIFGASRNTALLKSIADIDAEFDRRKKQAALGRAA